VTHQSVENFIDFIDEENIHFKGRSNRPPEPKNGIWGQKSVYLCDISIDRELYMEHEEYMFGGSKLGPQSPKMEFRAQIQYGCVIGHFTWTKKNILLGIKKAK
jgi:hypothetical protein